MARRMRKRGQSSWVIALIIAIGLLAMIIIGTSLAGGLGGDPAEGCGCSPEEIETPEETDTTIDALPVPEAPPFT